MVNLFSDSPFKTKKLGEILGKEILKTKKTKSALILGLEGDLGGGKTTFLQGFVKGLGIKEKILSPTFVIMRKFKIRANSCPNSRKFENLYHIDCYRLQKPKEILSLGFKKIISNSQNVVAIEWAERIYKILPPSTLIIKFKFLGQNKREMEIKYAR